MAGKVAIEQLLESRDVFNVDCEPKESEVDRYVGPTLVPPYRYLTLVFDVQVSGSFTPTIGACISLKDKSNNEEPENSLQY